MNVCYLVSYIALLLLADTPLRRRRGGGWIKPPLIYNLYMYIFFLIGGDFSWENGNTPARFKATDTQTDILFIYFLKLQ